MSFKSLHQVLGSLENHESWKMQRRFQLLLACWFEVVGPAVAAQTRPLSIQRQVLRVATSSSAWAQNLAFERLRILEKLNARLSTNLTDIRFSSAQWQLRSKDEQSTAALVNILWREHPSRIFGASPAASTDALTKADDPNTAFQNWAKRVQARSHALPLCPQCQCPTPTGELGRWSICALCAAKQW